MGKIKLNLLFNSFLNVLNVFPYSYFHYNIINNK